MTSYTDSGATTSYTYRADGMRTLKQTANDSTAYRYDGHMGFEDVNVNNGITDVTLSTLGARGVDAIQDGTNLAFPLYDSHGNMVATIARQGTGCAIGNKRIFDPWGMIRDGSGDPKGGYCASLGHKRDGESGLVYMRARYYEPASGRFISEDPAMEGANWYGFANNNPVLYADCSGKGPEVIPAVVVQAAASIAVGFFIGKLAADAVFDAYLRLTDEIDPERRNYQGDRMSAVLDFRNSIVGRFGMVLLEAVAGLAIGSLGLNGPAKFGVSFTASFLLEVNNLTIECILSDMANDPKI